MVEPELHSDEVILARTPGISVKSILFEGILTNRRILLLDMTKDFLPPKEILLATVKDVEPGENAIRDQIITLAVITRSGETRQMVLTFSRKAGGNRIKERDEWVRAIKKYASSSFEQAIHPKIPYGAEPSHRRADVAPSPRIEVINSPVRQAASREEPERRRYEEAPPVKRIIETGRVDESIPVEPAAPENEPVAQEPSYGTYCSRCGNKVIEGSAFCNRCGSPIVTPGTISSAPISPRSEPLEQRPSHAPEYPQDESHNRSGDRDKQSYTFVEQGEPGVAAGRRVSKDRSPIFPESGSLPDESPVRDEKPAAKKGMLAGLFFRKGPRSSTPGSNISIKPPKPQKSPKPPRERSPLRLPGKRTFLIAAIIVVVIVVVVAGALFVLPMVSGGSTSQSGPNPTPTVTATIAPQKTSSSGSPQVTGTFVVPAETTAQPVPAAGVWVHVNYLGGWKGTYGLPSDLKTVTSSGDKFYQVENATGTVQASIAKQDTSTKRDIVVEIYKDGKLLTKGNTNAALGQVILSVDVSTGVAKTPQTSPGTAPVQTTVKAATGNVTAVVTTGTATNATSGN